jgi:hypothetical protein
LVNPLPSGEIPAVEVARLLLEEEQEWRNDGPIDWAGVRIATGLVGELDVWLYRPAKILLTIYPDWKIQDWANAARPWGDALTYLRRHHFAVNLKPHQYVRKTPASAPAP